MVTIPKAEEGSLSDEIESAEKDIESTELSLKEKKEKLEKLKAKKKVPQGLCTKLSFKNEISSL